jgi:hypothetical protein
LILGTCTKSMKEIQMWLKSGKNIGYFKYVLLLPVTLNCHESIPFVRDVIRLLGQLRKYIMWTHHSVTVHVHCLSYWILMWEF